MAVLDRERTYARIAKKKDDEVLPDDIRSKASSSRVSEGAALISNFYERFSIQRPSPDEAFDYDELYDQMMGERFSDWIEL